MIKLADVATVEDGMVEAESAGFRGSRPAVLLNLRKQSGTNTVEVVENVKARIAELRPQLPQGYSVEVARDQSEFIENAIGAVKEHLIIGSFLAAIVVFLFLANARTTIISALAIPISIISTFALMAYAKFTLNSLTMLALTLAVGIVIDDAIVVLENIYRHIEEKGESPFDAAIKGTKEIGLAVMATTLSLIVVFMPVAFMGGIVGRFMNSFGLTMAFSIGVSLVVSFVLTPMLSSRWLKAHPPKVDPAQGPYRQPAKPPEPKGFGRAYSLIERGYMRILDWSLRHRWVIVLASVFTLLSSVPLGAAANKNFLPDEDESQFAVTMRAPEGASLDATRILATRIAADIEQIPGVRYAVTTIGDDAQKTPNLAQVYVKLVPTGERDRSQQEIVVEARKTTEAIAKAEKLRIQVGPVPAFSGGGSAAAVQLQVQGTDLRKLEQYAEKILEAIKAAPGVADTDTSLITGKPELRATIDRKKASELGVSVADIAGALRLLVGGYEVGNYAEAGEQYDVFARAIPSARNDAESLGRIAVPSMKLGTVTLDNLVTFTEGSGPSRIDRYNRRKSVYLYANVLPGSSQQAILDAAMTAAKDLQMEPGYQLSPMGQSKELGKAAQNFLIAFFLSFVFMYLVLAAQFESWLHPITILLSLPLTVPFALVSIIIFGQSLNIFSSLGILVLFGVVKKNSILQIDHTISLRAQGMPREAAIRQANRDRLRPILMTTIAFVAGMIPLVLSSGAGAGTNRATGFVIIGGQSLALLLTLARHTGRLLALRRPLDVPEAHLQAERRPGGGPRCARRRRSCPASGRAAVERRHRRERHAGRTGDAGPAVLIVGGELGLERLRDLGERLVELVGRRGAGARHTDELRTAAEIDQLAAWRRWGELLEVHVAVVHDAVDQHEPHVGRGRVDERLVGVHRVARDHEQVGLLADLDAAEFALLPDVAGGVDRHHVEEHLGREQAVPEVVAHVLSEAQLVEHVLAPAHRPIGRERDVDALLERERDVRRHREIGAEAVEADVGLG
jgi:hydrophobic/amphiphilic exporter-1 (mainly G- bacteria), HAE1 family